MDNFFIKKYPAVKNKSFVRLLTSQLLSQSGGYIQNVALSALITEMTGSRMSLGIFLCVSYAPVFLFSYFAGRLTRKIPAKHMLIATEILLLAMSSALIFLSEMPFWGFLVFGALWGTVRAFQTPAATSMPKLMCDRTRCRPALRRSALPCRCRAPRDLSFRVCCHIISHFPTARLLIANALS